MEEVLRVKSISDILGGRAFSFGAKRPESLTESARRFNAGEIADTDFFAVAQPSRLNFRVVSFAALALIAGSAAIGVTISSMRSDMAGVAAGPGSTGSEAVPAGAVFGINICGDGLTEREVGFLAALLEKIKESPLTINQRMIRNSECLATVRPKAGCIGAP